MNGFIYSRDVLTLHSDGYLSGVCDIESDRKSYMFNLYKVSIILALHVTSRMNLIYNN